MNSGSVSRIRIGRTATLRTPKTSATTNSRRQSPSNEIPGTIRVAAQSAAALISRRQTICMSPAVRRQKPGAHPPQDEIARGFVARDAVDDRGGEGGAANGVHESNGGSANRDRPDGQSAYRQAKTDRPAAQGERQAQRPAAEGHQAARHAADGNAADRDVPDGNDSFRN